jgi:hypothetical protein
MAGRANQQYLYKKEAVSEAYDAGEWHSFVFLHERPYRFTAFGEVAGLIDETAVWELFSVGWTDSENIYQNLDEIEQMLLDAPTPAVGMMDDDDQAHYNLLPDEVAIYRGWIDRGTAEGWSWTLDKSRAEWFGRRLRQGSDGGYVATATVAKSDIIAVLLGRGEFEVVVNPDHVNVTSHQEVPA